MMREETKAWIEREFEDCTTIMELTQRYADLRSSIDQLLQNRINEIIDGMSLREVHETITSEILT